jgi:uncharacterized protein YlxP (DUF503 family)
VWKPPPRAAPRRRADKLHAARVAAAAQENWLSEPLMPVGLLTLELHIPDAQSLKDKRQVLRSLKDKLRREFNVAVAELEHHDTWQRSVVGVVTLSNEEKHVKEVLQKVLDAADGILGSFLINQAIEII